jgi:uncharacterized repeat protein (TIGR01451 family)
VNIRGNQPRLTIRKERQGPSPVQVGDTVQFWIDVTNNGTGPAAVVPLVDEYDPARFDYVSAVPAPSMVDTTTGMLTWANIGPLNPGQTASVSVRLKTKAPGIASMNCAETRYTLPSGPIYLKDCDSVDVYEGKPGIQVEKVVVVPADGDAVAVGETVGFRVTVRNTGPTPLTNVVVRDEFDPSCLAFLFADGMPTVETSPGVLTTDVGTLAAHADQAWTVYFRAVGPCSPARNCVSARGTAPDGTVVSAEACRAIRIVPGQPGLDVQKRQVAPEGFPPLNGIVRYEVLVRNTGNVVLGNVVVGDTFDPDCMQFVNADPFPATVDPVTGTIGWGNIGPLAPGSSRLITVWLRLVGPCTQIENCAKAEWVDGGVVRLSDEDCAQTFTGAPIYRVYCPVVMRGPD